MSKWPMVPLREVLVPVSRPEIVDSTSTYRILGARWYALGLYIKDTLSGAEIQAPKVYRVRSGDFVYNRLFAWKGSFAVASAATDGCYVSNEFPCFEVNPKRLSPYFLWRYLSREAAWNEALGLSTGGTPTSRNRLKEARFLQMEIPLPPLPEQERIVKWIDSIAERVNEVRQLQSESRVARGTMVASQMRRSFDSLTRQYPEGIIGEFATHITSGPRNWSNRTVDSGDRFYRAQDILPEGRLATSGKVYIETPSTGQGAGAKLIPGDLMIVITGATVGRIAVYPADAEPGYVSQHVAICRIDARQLNPNFACIALLSPSGQAQLLGQRYGQGKPGLNLTNIRRLRLPIPPLSVQDKVVADFMDFKSAIDQLANEQESVRSELDAMLPAVLNRAFQGEL